MMKSMSPLLFTVCALLSSNALAYNKIDINGKFRPVEGSSEKCKEGGTYSVAHYNAKRAILGAACGEVLWLSSASNPVGVFFCNAKSQVEDKIIGINLFNPKGEKPDFYISTSGRINDTSVQMVVPADINASGVFSRPNIVSSKTVLTKTHIGIDFEDTITLNDGTIETSKCQYKQVNN